jgi:Fe-S cluster assembly protein SufB
MSSTKMLEDFANKEYEHGFVTEVDQDVLPPGLDEDVIRTISARKNEPEWLLEWRLKAFAHWQTMEEPHWPMAEYPPVDYQAISYFAAPKKQELESLDEVDPEILATYEKLGIPLEEQKILAGVAVDAVFDRSRSRPPSRTSWPSWGSSSARSPKRCRNTPNWCASTSDRWCRSRQLLRHPQLGGVHRRLLRLHPQGRPLPHGAEHLLPDQRPEHRPVRAHADRRRRGPTCRYLEGCTAPQRDENQLHAAVVELVALRDAEIKYSTVQNWYPGDKETGAGGIYNFVTKRGICRGDRAKISWTQVETGSAITWKYPSVILKGDDTVGEFYSVALTAGRQQADTGTKMIHLGNNTRSTIISKGISAGRGQNTYRGLVKVAKNAEGCAQLQPVRLHAHRRPLRRPHLSDIEVRNPRLRWSTRRPPRRSVRTRSSTATSAASTPRTPCP